VVSKNEHEDCQGVHYRNNDDALLSGQQERHKQRNAPRHRIREQEEFRCLVAPKITPQAHHFLQVLICGLMH